MRREKKIRTFKENKIMLHMSMYRCRTSVRHMERHLVSGGTEVPLDTEGLEKDESFSSQFKEAFDDFYAWNADGNPEGLSYFHFIISDDPEDEKSAGEMQALSLKFAKKAFPGCQFFVGTQEGFRPGATHTHVVVNAVCPRAGMIVPVRGRDYHDLFAVLCAVGKEFGFDPDASARKTGMSVKRTHEEVQILARGGFSWKEDLRDKIRDAVFWAKDVDDFFRLLEKDGIAVETTWSGRDFLYRHPGARFACSGERLGLGFTREEVEKSISKKRTAAAGRR